MHIKDCQSFKINSVKRLMMWSLDLPIFRHETSLVIAGGLFMGGETSRSVVGCSWECFLLGRFFLIVREAVMREDIAAAYSGFLSHIRVAFNSTARSKFSGFSQAKCVRVRVCVSAGVSLRVHHSSYVWPGACVHPSMHPGLVIR